LSYEAKAQVGGKLAQVGSRLIDSVVKKMADDFFTVFRLQLAPPAPADAAAAAPSAKAVVQSSPPTNRLTTVATPAPVSSASATGVVMVPGWWLAPAALLGALLVIAGARLIHG
jgi:hypothetical protein